MRLAERARGRARSWSKKDATAVSLDTCRGNATACGYESGSSETQVTGRMLSVEPQRMGSPSRTSPGAMLLSAEPACARRPRLQSTEAGGKQASQADDGKRTTHATALAQGDALRSSRAAPARTRRRALA